MPCSKGCHFIDCQISLSEDVTWYCCRSEDISVRTCCRSAQRYSGSEMSTDRRRCCELQVWQPRGYIFRSPDDWAPSASAPSEPSWSRVVTYANKHQHMVASRVKEATSIPHLPVAAPAGAALCCYLQGRASAPQVARQRSPPEHLCLTLSTYPAARAARSPILVATS